MLGDQGPVQPRPVEAPEDSVSQGPIPEQGGEIERTRDDEPTELSERTRDDEPTELSERTRERAALLGDVLIDTGFAILWLASQALANIVIEWLAVHADFFTLVILRAIQAAFAIAVGIPVLTFVWGDIQIAWLKNQARVSRTAWQLRSEQREQEQELEASREGDHGQGSHTGH